MCAVLAATVGMILNLWPALLRDCDNGVIEIENSRRALRGDAIGRRSYLSVGADSGVERAVAIHS